MSTTATKQKSITAQPQGGTTAQSGQRHSAPSLRAAPGRDAPHPHSPLSPLSGDYCNLPLYVKSDAFFRKPDSHEPCPVVPPREASIRSLARGYHPPARHLTLDPAAKPPGLPPPSSSSSSSTTLPQRTLPMPTAASTAPAPAPAPAAPAEPPANTTTTTTTHSKVGGSRDSLLEMSTSGAGRAQKQGAGAYSKSYTLV